MSPGVLGGGSRLNASDILGAMDDPTSLATPGVTSGAGGGQRPGRHLTRAAVTVSVACGVWMIADPWITHERMPAFTDVSAVAWRRAYRRLDDGFAARQWVIAALVLVAVGLAIAAMRDDRPRRRRIANGVGVGAVSGVVIAGFVAAMAPEGPPNDRVAPPVLVALAIAIAAAAAATLVARRTAPDSAPALSPSGRRHSRTAALAGGGLVAVGIVATVVVYVSLDECGRPSSTLVGVAFWVALLAAAAAVIIGIAVTIMRRWAAGLALILAGSGTVLAGLIAALRCLE